MGATGGLRRLEETQQQNIIRSTQKALASLSAVVESVFGNPKTITMEAKVVPVENEALLGFLSGEWVFQNIAQETGTPLVLDLGGESLEMTGKDPISGQSTTLGEDSEGYGSKARRRAYNEVKGLNDPCSTLAPEAPADEGRFKACVELMQKNGLIPKTAFEKHFGPNGAAPYSRVQAIATFEWAPKRAVELVTGVEGERDKVWCPSELVDVATKACSKYHELYTKNPQTCIELAYEYLIMTDVLHMAPDERKTYFSGTVAGRKLGWPLGLALKAFGLSSPPSGGQQPETSPEGSGSFLQTKRLRRRTSVKSK
uniref:Ppx/GppA phosphatase domain-containing protein n=1 Tax=Chromera velia CCMP2878 TaxID=1169474 RepID=A0A0G4FT57_9ALVE|eukprot:Cvel_18587.t1-p1 / transcript=Cvel_18587.t1 / gene=Cvel_18587 / organism=Chromera_velia_CCMP2878 / gene_product=hypothetical protein / transcript_product=hypothetical protein / location=Cvel_scaffold1550:33603-34538(+) / protein_length=312 / sequence_SO=supercontig / SO=protein_coding / is_pseudo=false